MKKWYVLLAAAAAFSLLARYYDPFPGDVSLIQWVQGWQRPALTAFMQGVSAVGRSWILVGLAGIVTAGLFIARRRREGLAAAGVVMLLLLTPFLQLLVDRPRPPADMVGLTTPMGGRGFPSGHAYQSFVLCAFLIYLAHRLIGRTWVRRAVQAGLAFLMLSIGVSRVYLGAHWPSDVLGAYLLGGSLLALWLQRYPSIVPVLLSHWEAGRHG